MWSRKLSYPVLLAAIFLWAIPPLARPSFAADCVSVTFAPNEPHKLHGAAAFGCVDSARELIMKGADVNAKDQNGMTPLDVASATGHLEVVKLLLSKGADLKKASGPLHLAVANNRLDVVTFFLDQKLVDVNQKAEGGKTPLAIAEKAKNKKMIDVLMSRGATD